MISFTQISVPVASMSKKSRLGKAKSTKSVRDVPHEPSPPPPDDDDMDFNNPHSSPLPDLFDPDLDDIVLDTMLTQSCRHK